MYKAYQGANGWYVAWEGRDGTHSQPSLGSWLSRERAQREARRLNQCDL